MKRRVDGALVAVLGAGRSGQAAAKLALAEGARVVVLDGGDPGKLHGAAEALRAMGCEKVVLGDEADAFSGVLPDLAIQSPGINLRRPIVRQFTERGVPVIGELEFAAQRCGARMAAITGTNGKTTTTELVERVLRAGGLRATSAGNYGVPLSEIVVSGEAYDAIALEVSSFQLEAIETFRPEIGVWMNFAPDHLDRYDSVADYRAAKERMFENQQTGDWIVIQAPLAPIVANCPANVVTFSAFETADLMLNGTVIERSGVEALNYGALKLRGAHNAENVMAALAVGEIIGVSGDEVEAALRDYTAPPHRYELVGEHQGHEFINDSKSTNLHSLESSLRGQPDKVVLIAGGRNKGFDFASARGIVGENVSHAVLMGECGPEMASAWEGAVPCTVVPGLEEAVEESLRVARPKGAIIFSPGAASFDQFSNYIERGEVFRRLIDRLGSG